MQWRRRSSWSWPRADLTAPKRRDVGLVSRACLKACPDTNREFRKGCPKVSPLPCSERRPRGPKPAWIPCALRGAEAPLFQGAACVDRFFSNPSAIRKPWVYTTSKKLGDEPINNRNVSATAPNVATQITTMWSRRVRAIPVATRTRPRSSMSAPQEMRLEVVGVERDCATLARAKTPVRTRADVRLRPRRPAPMRVRRCPTYLRRIVFQSA
jgi:hypothetical protein